MAKMKPFLIDGIKCQCGRPTYIHLTSFANGRVNFACDRYIYTRGSDGCLGYVEADKMTWEDTIPQPGKEEFFSNVGFMNRT
jgi:hypothetical protein